MRKQILEYANLSSLIESISSRGSQVKSGAYKKQGKFPIVDQGQSLIVGYTDEDIKPITDIPAVVFGDHTRIVKLVDFPFVAGADGTKIIKPNSDKIDRLYFYYLVDFAASKMDSLGYSRHFKELKEIDVTYHRSLSEQKKIATILRAWDEAIERASNLLVAQVKKKQALQQKLLSGKKRLPGFSGAWKSQKLKELTEELKDRNQDNKMGMDKIMGVNKVYGLIPMREETIGASIDRYKNVPPDAFAYNPMRINIGSLARSHHDHPVLVSPDYVVFSCAPEKLDADYFDHFRRSHTWEKYMEAAGNGSVRIRIYYNDLGELKIRLPEIKEQKAVAAVLNTCDNQLRLIEQEIGTLKAQKRGLMQKLLTGEWPVRVEKEAA